MQSKLSCNVCQDLLPLYADDLVSEKTKTEIEQHLASCTACSLTAARMMKVREQNEKETAEMEEKEVDYLKKMKKNNKTKITVGIVSALILCLMAAGAGFFIIPRPLTEFSPSRVRMDGGSVEIRGSLEGTGKAYTGYQIQRQEKGSRLVLDTVNPSFLHSDEVYHFTIASYDLSFPLSIGQATVEPDGRVITALAHDLYDNRTPYAGDAAAGGRLLEKLNVEDLGTFHFELKTEHEPYGWILHFEQLRTEPDVLNSQMKGIACILLALTDNLDEVSWEYTSPENGQPVLETMTQQQAQAYVSQPIKTYAISANTMQNLLDVLYSKYGLSFHDNPYVLLAAA